MFYTWLACLKGVGGPHPQPPPAPFHEGEGHVPCSPPALSPRPKRRANLLNAPGAASAVAQQAYSWSTAAQLPDQLLASEAAAASAVEAAPSALPSNLEACARTGLRTGAAVAAGNAWCCTCKHPTADALSVHYVDTVDEVWMLGLVILSSN